MPIRRTSWLASALLVGAVSAQADGAAPPSATPDGQRLQKLLRELATTDAGAWAARMLALEQAAKAHEVEAAGLREQATRLQAQATAKDEAAKKLRAEIERLQKLQALVRAMAPAATEPAGDTPAPAKPAAMSKGAPTPKADAAPEALVTWTDHIEDLLGQHCSACHDPDSKKGGLDVTSFAAIRQGGGSGSTLVPGAPDQSRLLRLLTRQERPFMPKDEDQLPAPVLAMVRQWIEQGACEDEASAREFVAERAAEKAKASATPAPDAAKDAPPMPEDLPSIAVRRPERPAAIKSLVRSPRANLLAMPGQQQVLLFDTDLQLLGALPTSMAQVEAVGFSPDGATVFAAGGERGKRGKIEVFDVRTGAPMTTVGNERDTPLAAAVASGHKLIAVGGAGKHARVHGHDGPEVFAGKHDDFVLALAFSPDGSRLAAGDRTGVVLVWETRGGRLGQTLSGHQGAVHAVAFADDKSLATAGADGTVRLWEVAGGKERWRQAAHAGEALAVAFGPDQRIATCGSDGRVRVFTSAGKPVAQSATVGEWLYGVAFGATGDVVFAGDWQGRVHRFDVKTKKLTSSVPLGPIQ